MKTRICSPYLLFTLMALLSIGWFWSHPKPAALLPIIASPVAAAIDRPQTPLLPVKAMFPDTNAIPGELIPDQHSIDDRIAGLNELATKDDVDSLNLILVSLTDVNPQIRAAALDATVQFDRPEAIPALQDALALEPAPQEKVNLQNAIDYLTLPSFAQNTSARP